MIFLEFPSQDDWKRIHQQSPCIGLKAQLNQLLESLKLGDGIEDFFRAVELQELVWQLNARQVDVAKSYVMLHYYFEKGIPDDEWYQSPGKDGSSIQYYPHFEEKHFHIKNWFDYYSDTFYYKLFSAWNIVGHILNVFFRLNIKPNEVYFHRAVNDLKLIQTDLWKKLDTIRDAPVYRRAQQLRNDVTHNYLPSSVGLGITKEESEQMKTTTMGNRKYTTSKEIMDNVPAIVVLYRETIEALIER